MMLVQTTVAAVVPYFARFLARFPTSGRWPRPTRAEVLKAWEGLGYYRRARQLHAAARAIVADHGGTFPDDPEAIRALPGVGRYIAGAILSFAFDRPAPIVEANTQRVLARWLAWREDLQADAVQARLWQAAGRLVPADGRGHVQPGIHGAGRPGLHPQGAALPGLPGRGRLPGPRPGDPGAGPGARRPSRPRSVVTEACALVRAGGRWLIVQRGPGGLWEQFWEFPTIHLAGADPAGRCFGDPVDLAEGVRRLTGRRVRIGPLVATVRYGVTRHRVELRAYRAVGLAEPLIPGPGLVRAAWESPEALVNYPFGSARRRLVAWVAEHGAEGRSPTRRRTDASGVTATVAPGRLPAPRIPPGRLAWTPIVL